MGSRLPGVDLPFNDTLVFLAGLYTLCTSCFRFGKVAKQSKLLFSGHRECYCVRVQNRHV